jgi:hypothetical protein
MKDWFLSLTGTRVVLVVSVAGLLLAVIRPPWPELQLLSAVYFALMSGWTFGDLFRRSHQRA